MKGKELLEMNLERERTFINDQLKRGQELLKILEIKEKEMEQNMLQKADVFGYLYKEHQPSRYQETT